MNIKYIGNGAENGRIHAVKDSSHTACGKIYSDNMEDWEYTEAPITCEKLGCKHEN